MKMKIVGMGENGCSLCSMDFYLSGIHRMHFLPSWPDLEVFRRLGRTRPPQSQGPTFLTYLVLFWATTSWPGPPQLLIRYCRAAVCKPLIVLCSHHVTIIENKSLLMTLTLSHRRRKILAVDISNVRKLVITNSKMLTILISLISYAINFN